MRLSANGRRVIISGHLRLQVGRALNTGHNQQHEVQMQRQKMHMYYLSPYGNGTHLRVSADGWEALGYSGRRYC